MKKKDERNLHSPMIPFSYNKKVLSKSTDVRIYRDTILLTTGEYADSMSPAPVVYTEESLKDSATNWSSNYLNVDHSFEVQKRLGFVENTYWKDSKVMGDLYIFPITQAARDTIALIDAGLVNWLSVEITTHDTWDSEDNKRYANDITFIGCAICLFPACDGTRIRND